MLAQTVRKKRDSECPLKEAINYTVLGTPLSIVAKDFNNDSNVDLATANGSSGNISILLGNGSGSYTSSVNYTVSGQPQIITSADFNNNTLADIATVNSSGDVSVLMGNGIARKKWTKIV